MAAPTKKIKKQDHERITDSNIQKVIELLGNKPPITKKEACEILNITYNTTRLQSIIDDYNARKAYEQSKRDKNKGKPATELEICSVIEDYLEGSSVADIANKIYRSSTFVKAIIERLGIPQKVMGDAKNKPAILPDECVAESFNPGQIVWSAKYHGPCKVVEEVQNTDTTNYVEKYGCKCYKIFVMEVIEEPSPFFPRVTTGGGFYAYSPAYDLGSLEHLFKYKVKLNV
jgi:hypothetical protein